MSKATLWPSRVATSFFSCLFFTLSVPSFPHSFTPPLASPWQHHSMRLPCCGSIGMPCRRHSLGRLSGSWHAPPCSLSANALMPTATFPTLVLPQRPSQTDKYVQSERCGKRMFAYVGISQCERETALRETERVRREKER